MLYPDAIVSYNVIRLYRRANITMLNVEIQEGVGTWRKRLKL